MKYCEKNYCENQVQHQNHQPGYECTQVISMEMFYGRHPKEDCPWVGYLAPFACGCQVDIK